MANPVIDSATPVPSSLAPSETSVITILHHDDDTHTVTLSFTVTDSLGGVSVPQEVTLPVVDTATFRGSIISGGGTLTQTGIPNIWNYTA